MKLSVFRWIIVAFLSVSTTGFTAPTTLAHPLNQHGFYLGALTGFGDTNWERLVSQDQASSNATPSFASGKGAILGGLIGYQFSHYFAIQSEYIHYPDSTVKFNAAAQQFLGLNFSQLNTATNYFALLSKFMLPIGESNLSAFSALGFAYVHRHDRMADTGDFRPTFGFGFDYKLSHRVVTELGFSYTPGTGKAVENAAASYIPYLYSGQFALMVLL